MEKEIKKINQCRFCGKELFGLTPCICRENLENTKLWNSSERIKERRSKKK